MATECNEASEIIKWGLSIGIPALAGVGGVFLGAFLSGSQEKKRRKYLFIERQLKEFYSPLLGLRTEIQMKSELRESIHATTETVWQKLCEQARESADPDEMRKLTEERSEEFDSIIKYDNRMLKEALIPAYRQMVKLFRENMWLAEPATKKHLKELMEFVDIWDRSLNQSLPIEVLKELEHDEKKLHSFYKDLEDTSYRLRSKLESGEI